MLEYWGVGRECLQLGSYRTGGSHIEASKIGSVPKMRFFRATHVARYRIAKILILKLHL